VATTYYPDSSSATVTQQAQTDQRGRSTNTQMQLALPSGWNVTTSLPQYQLAVSYNDANQITTTSATAGTATYTFTQVYDPTCGSGTLGSTLSGAGYTAPYQYTNLGQIWQAPANGTGYAQEYLYCNSSHPHTISGLYPLGITCANQSGAVYHAVHDDWGNTTT